MDNLLPLLLQVFLIALNAIFACAEIALLSMNDNKLAKLAEQGDKRAIRLQKLKEQPSRFLATIQLAITLAGFLGSAFAAENFSDSIVDWLIGIGVPIPAATLNTIAVVVITLILSYFTLVLGELVPKRVAMRKADSLALGLTTMLYGISKIFSPLVSLLTVSTNAVLRMMGIDPNAADDEVSEEDIIMMVDEGSETGAIDDAEKEFIQNVFEFDDLTAGEIATHRTDVFLLWMDEDMEQWKETIYESRHNLYPVCDETVDRVVGILNAKDYFRLENKDRETVLEKAVKPAYFVPESVKADVLFQNMKKNHHRFAIVLDEYGGMNGIITMTDLIEKLVGELDSEHEEESEPPEIEKISEKTWKIVGTVELSKVEEELDIILPCDEYDTFGGLIFGSLGSVPDDGTSFELETDGLSIKVTEVLDHQVKTAIVTILEKEEESEEEK